MGNYETMTSSSFDSDADADGTDPFDPGDPFDSSDPFDAGDAFDPLDFDLDDPSLAGSGATSAPPVRRLVRNPTSGFGGVASGIAHYVNLDVSIVRILFVVLSIFGGLGLVVYLAGWIFIPRAQYWPPLPENRLSAQARQPLLILASILLVIWWWSSSEVGAIQLVVAFFLVAGGVWLLSKRERQPVTMPPPPAMGAQPMPPPNPTVSNVGHEQPWVPGAAPYTTGAMPADGIASNYYTPPPPQASSRRRWLLIPFAVLGGLFFMSIVAGTFFSFAGSDDGYYEASATEVIAVPPYFEDSMAIEGGQFCGEAFSAFGEMPMNGYYMGDLNFHCVSDNGFPVFVDRSGRFYNMSSIEADSSCGETFGAFGEPTPYMNGYFMGDLEFHCVDNAGFPLFIDDFGRFYSISRIEESAFDVAEVDELDEPAEALEDEMVAVEDERPAARQEPSDPSVPSQQQSFGRGVVIVDGGEAFWSESGAVESSPISSEDVGSPLAPVDFANLPERIDGTGGVTLDLTNLDADTFDGSLERVDISHANGNVTVIVPDWMSIAGQASIANGQLSIFGENTEGPVSAPFERTNDSNLMVTFDVELVGGTFAVVEG